MTATALPRVPGRRRTRQRLIGFTARTRRVAELVGIPYGREARWTLTIAGDDQAHDVEDLTLVQDLQGWAAIADLGSGARVRLVGHLTPPALLARAALIHNRSQEEP